MVCPWFGTNASQFMNRKLLYSKENYEVPPLLALSDHASVESARQPDLGSQMDSFLSYLLFWQDTMDHCRSAEVNDTLLDHFQILFLQQLLLVFRYSSTFVWFTVLTQRFHRYPSLLESSDVDGGSTSAVLTYLSQILEAIDQPDLVHKILQYLLASPTGKNSQPVASKEKSRMSISRRKSLDLLASFAEASAKPSPELFNLVDLVLMSITSKNIQTVAATLRLIRVIVQRHPTFAKSLLKTVQDAESSEGLRTIGALNAELSQFVDLAISIIYDPSVDDSYESYLIDASARLDPLIMPFPEDELSGEYPLILKPDEGVLKGIFDLLGKFFVNSVVTNLALTDAITSLASSGLISLEGWILVQPSRYQHDAGTPSSEKDASSPQETETANDSGGDIDSDETDPTEKLNRAYEQPLWRSSDQPALFVTLKALIDKIQSWRNEITDFDILMAARKELLHNDITTITEPQALDKESADSPGRYSIETPIKRASRSELSPRGRNRNLQERPDQSPSGSVADSISRSLFNTPLRESSSSKTSTPRSESHQRVTNPDSLRKRLALPAKIDSNNDSVDPPSEASADIETANADPQPPQPDTTSLEDALKKNIEFREENVSLGHVLTNSVILHEFILELSAIVQVRANAFQEVSFER